MFQVDAKEYISTWWLLALKGVLMMIFGFLAIIWPGATLLVLIVLFGTLVFFSGIFALAGVLTGRIASDQKWLVLAEGGVGVLVGLILFFFPRISAGTLLFLIALWAIVYGVIQVISAVNLRDELDNARLLGIPGGLSVIAGIVFLAFPIGALATIAFLLGMVAFVVGSVTIVFAWRLRSLAEFQDSTTETAQKI